jgi:hypothetical protein
MTSKFFNVISILLANLFLFVGQASEPAKWLVSNNLTPLCTDEQVKDFCLGAGTFFTLAIIPLQIFLIKRNNKTNEEALSSMLKLWKNVLTGLLRDATKQNSLKINVRFFVPKKWHKRHFSDWLAKRIEFEIINIEGLADKDHTTGLCFEVKPIPRGIVGQVYSINSMAYDLNVQNSQTSYNLTPYHQQNVRAVTMVFGVPIVDSNNRVKYIITIDSEDRLPALNAAEEQKLVNIVYNYLTLAESLITSLTTKRTKV